MKPAILLPLLVVTLLAPSLSVSAADIEVIATESTSRYFFRLGDDTAENPTLQLEPGQEVTIEFHNLGRQYHNFRLGPPIDEATPLLGPGESHELTVRVPEDQEVATQYWCEPHKIVRMFGTALIGDAEPPDEERVPTAPALGPLLVLIALFVLRDRRPR